MVKFCCFSTVQVRCWDGLATAENEAGILSAILASFFPASFLNDNGIVAHLRCLFNPYLEWVEEEELFIEGLFSTCCHLKKVRDRQGWVGNRNGGLFLVA